MPSMRVHELAKEFGMTSKELLDRIQALKIPAKNHASTLIEPYVDKIRKELAVEIAERQAKMAEEAAKREAEEAAVREAEEAARKVEEAERLKIEAEERAVAEAERKEREAEEAAVREAEEAARKAEEEAERLRAEAAHVPPPAPPTPVETTDESVRVTPEAQAELDKAEEDRYRQMAREAEASAKVSAPPSAGVAIEFPVAQPSRGRPVRGAKRKKGRKGRDVEETEETTTAAVAPLGEGGTISVREGATVGEFAEAAGVPANEVIKRLLMLGELMTVNNPIGRDAAELVAEALGYTVEFVAPEAELEELEEDRPDDLVHRAPVVTVMGHVDHGKTSLLDAIRETGVAATEAGGITQHIGASVVRKNDKQITFIDTPGHEAFTAMRARGANTADIAILVVAADDGVMPQTVEAINHAKAANVPIIVAVNKIDKEGANLDRVRQELVDQGLVPEEWGGDTVFVNVSAKKRIGIEELLEMILLVADLADFKANPTVHARGVVIESNLDRGRGPVATVLVQRGTLRIGDAVVAGKSYGRVRALIGPTGDTVKTALPSDPVEILGLASVPEAGDDFKVVADERKARQIAEERALRRRLIAQERRAHVTLDDLFSRIQEGELKDLNLVIKADVQGSIEALTDALEKMDQTEVRINVIHSGVGAITESDVMLADASDAIVVGFNVRPEPKAKAAAEQTKVDMRLYAVIYKFVEDINAARVGMLAPTFEEQETAQVEVRETFRVPKIGVIAGCYVTDGEVSRDDQVRVVRDGTVVFTGKIASLRRFKDDVKSVRSGYECGIGVADFADIKVGDVIEAFRTIEVAREE